MKPLRRKTQSEHLPALTPAERGAFALARRLLAALEREGRDPSFVAALYELGRVHAGEQSALLRAAADLRWRREVPAQLSAAAAWWRRCEEELETSTADGFAFAPELEACMRRPIARWPAAAKLEQAARIRAGRVELAGDGPQSAD